MRTAHPGELEAVLEHAEVAVGAVEIDSIRAPDIAAGTERPNGAHGVPHPQGGIDPAVHQLKQLHGELDVAKAPRSQLELPGLLAAGDVLRHPPPHGPHRLDEAVALGGGPDQRRDALLVAAAQLGVARHGPGFQERLELPHLRPSFVVAQVRLERADQRTVPGRACAASGVSWTSSALRFAAVLRSGR